MKLVSWEEGQSKEYCNDPDEKGDILHFSGNKTNDKAGKQEEPWMACPKRYFWRRRSSENSQANALGSF